ncbi:phosphoribosyltransferase [Alistipes sp. OttesenSCG-928-L06]|nr:phosphoribosyltransferase [Alistipes sp. OttesenSCG-928-L06]
MKDGLCPELAARLVFLAAERNEDIPRNDENTVLIPIPASTDETHRLRFEKYCAELSRLLGVTDGYSLLELTMQREEGDIKKGMPLSTAMRLTDNGSLAGKRVIVVDDLITSGTSFSQMAAYLMSADVESVTGLFLAKTVGVRF